jgi:hypothetical protein
MVNSCGGDMDKIKTLSEPGFSGLMDYPDVKIMYGDVTIPLT